MHRKTIVLLGLRVVTPKIYEKVKIMFRLMKPGGFCLSELEALIRVRRILQNHVPTVMNRNKNDHK